MTQKEDLEVGMFLGKASGSHSSTSSGLQSLALLLMELKMIRKYKMELELNLFCTAMI